HPRIAEAIGGGNVENAQLVGLGRADITRIDLAGETAAEARRAGIAVRPRARAQRARIDGQAARDIDPAAHDTADDVLIGEIAAPAEEMAILDVGDRLHATVLELRGDARRDGGIGQGVAISLDRG